MLRLLFDVIIRSETSVEWFDIGIIRMGTCVETLFLSAHSSRADGRIVGV